MISLRYAYIAIVLAGNLFAAEPQPQPPKPVHPMMLQYNLDNVPQIPTELFSLKTLPHSTSTDLPPLSRYQKRKKTAELIGKFIGKREALEQKSAQLQGNPLPNQKLQVLRNIKAIKEALDCNESDLEDLSIPTETTLSIQGR